VRKYTILHGIFEEKYIIDILKKEIVKTRDGSNTIFVPEFDETYHSTHGAIQESFHVFIRSGLKFKTELNDINVLEVGFGTGLNALLSFINSEKTNKNIKYTSIEAYPLKWDLLSKLNYIDLIFNGKYSATYKKIHTCDWESFYILSSFFTLRKQNVKLQDVSFDNEFDVIYFDAFAPRVQPELWTDQIFTSMYKALKPGGVLVTYCAKGSVKRALKYVGFELQSIPGPPGKREMSRAVKPSS
tara:strand:+ start:2510 stop:3238 length:729 start_codon:yes stop_codon:yes gene_type:complete